MKFFIESPYLLALIIPVIIALIILMKKSFVKFKNKKEEKEYEKVHKGRRIFIIISRCLIAVYLLIALSSPYTLTEEIVPGDISLKILVDNSTSMELYDNSVAGKVFDSLKEKIPITKISISSGTSSAIGDSIINNMYGDDNILLITDGQNNKGKDLAGVMFFANLLNTTVNAVSLSPINNDYSLTIEGPSEAIIGTENEFFIRIKQAGNPPDYSLAVSLDGKDVSFERIENNLYKFSKVLSEGYHKITAEITVTDYFKENNIYYKTLHVLPKPSLLYVSSGSPILYNQLKPLYNVHKRNDIPDDLQDYSAIILDDIPIDKLDSVTESLGDYVLEGGGLYVIGGDNSYDKGGYSNSLFETILPVKVGEAGYAGELAASIVIVMDISESTGQSFSTKRSEKKVDIEKSLALEILNGISLYDNVGVVAFNHKPYILSRLNRLSEIETNLTKKISALYDSGGTLIYSGLKQGQRLLDGSLGSKNIILISDGVDSIQSLSLDLAKEFARKNIKLYTVGVGESTNRAFLQTLAIETGAEYFEPTETEKLKILFGEREEEPVPEQRNSLVLFNTNHFITKGLNLDADVTGFNYVVKKSPSQMLVSMGDGKPIITVWRYGLGRVLALSTDNGDQWSSELLSKKNSKLIMRGVNWAIGNPQKNLDFYAQVKDGKLGEISKIVIKSDKRPVSDILKFEKTDEDRYVASFIPEKTGYEEFFKAVLAVNYPSEYEDIGFNDELRDIVEVTGGKMFLPEETDKLTEFIKQRSKRKKTSPNYIRWPFIVIALAILILEIFIRKIIESIRRGK